MSHAHVRRVLPGVLVILSLTLPGAAAWGALAERYTLTDLGDATGVTIAKDDNRVVGTRPIMGLQTAHEVAPRTINFGTLPDGNWSIGQGPHSGRSVGMSSVGKSERGALGIHTHAFIYEQGAMRDLGTFGGPELFSAAQAVTTEDIGGYCDSADQTRIIPCLWAGSTTIMALDTLGGEDGYIDAMNEKGDALGNSQTAAGDTHCTYWPALGGVIDCHPPTGGGTLSFGMDLNSTGLYVGTAYPSTGSRGFLGLPYGTVLLLPLPGDTHSVANSINNLGDIPGQGCRYPDRFGVCRAIVWQNGMPVDLQPRVTNADGWTLQHALGISEDGWIIGVGMRNGQQHSFVLTPQDDVVVAWYKWKASINRWYAHRYDRWRKSIDWYYREAARRR
jgi:probable HAF family extracellular repeat protein